MRSTLLSIVSTKSRWRKVVLFVLFGCLLALGVYLPTEEPLLIPSHPTVILNALIPTNTPSAFLYGVTVLDSDSQPIPNAQVLIEIQGKSPLENSADEHGYTEVEVPTSHAGRAGRLRVRASGFEPFNQYIDIYPDRLPNEVQLIAQIVGNTAGFCPDNLTFATGFAPAGEKETLIVISNFADTEGNDPRNLTYDLIERMTQTLDSHEQIRVERLNCAIKQQGGSDTAMRIGSRSDVDASIVIWGVYVEPPEPKIYLYFNIVKENETYLGAGFDHRFGPQDMQPDLVAFETELLGDQIGQVVAFATGLALYNADEHLAAEPLFTTAIAAADQLLTAEFSRALRYYRGMNYFDLGYFLEAKSSIELLTENYISRKFALDKLDIDILNGLGLVHSALGDNQQALEYFNLALKIWRESDDVKGVATALSNIGSIYSDLNEYQLALNYYNQSLQLSQQTNFKLGEASALNNIGTLYLGMGEEQLALNYYNQALPLVQQTTERASQAAILAGIGTAYLDLGENPRALDYYTQALSLMQQSGNMAGEADVLNYFGKVYDALGEKQQALEYFEAALLLRQKVGNKADEAATLNQIGNVYAFFGYYPKALNYSNQALSLISAVGDKAEEASILANIGTVYDELGDEQKALDFLSQALLIYRTTGNKEKEAVALNNIGRIYDDLNDEQKALDYFNQALSLRQKVGDKAGEATTLNNIGLIYEELGKTQKALGYYNQALLIHRSAGYKFGEAVTLSNIAGIYISEKSLDEALKYLAESLKILRELGAHGNELITLSNIAFVHFQRGELDTAAEYLKTAVTLATQLHHPLLDELQAQLAEINAQRAK